MTEDGYKQIVLTGGPGAGKSSALTYLSEKLSEMGYRVLTVPEAATMLITGGVPDIPKIASSDSRTYNGLERVMVGLQGAFRTHYQSLAQVFVDRGEKVVIIYDRAEPDCGAYMEQRWYHAILKENHLTADEVLNLYDGVVFMHSAAVGAAKHYTTANNKARREGMDEARDTNDRTLKMYTGFHHRLHVVRSRSNFEQKLHDVLRAVCRILGIPEPLEIEKKFLLESFPVFPDGLYVHASPIEQIYLPAHNGENLRIRKRGQVGSESYYLTLKRKISSGVRQERERRIGAMEYLERTKQRDPLTEIVRKMRHCFIYNDQYFELDLFEHPRRGLVLLEVELTSQNDKVELPPFLKVVREVTDEPEFGNYEIARIKA